jgi:hypothetical protein
VDLNPVPSQHEAGAVTGPMTPAPVQSKDALVGTSYNDSSSPPFPGFRNYLIGFCRIPWVGDRLVVRLLPTQDNPYTEETQSFVYAPSGSPDPCVRAAQACLSGGSLN